jgi:hypothetical protein
MLTDKGWTLMTWTKIKEIDMDMDAAEELKLTHKFEGGKKLPPPEVEIDPPDRSAIEY